MLLFALYSNYPSEWINSGNKKSDKLFFIFRITVTAISKQKQARQHGGKQELSKARKTQHNTTQHNKTKRNENEKQNCLEPMHWM